MDFSGFEADSQQLDNVAGLRRMWKVRAKSFVGEYPAKADIVDGEITVSPTVRLPVYFMPAEYKVPQNTAMYSDVLAGNRGYQAYRHVVGYQMAGLSKGLLKELLKDINAGAVYFLEDTNGNINVAGTSKKGLPLNTTGNSGKDGSEQRGKVMAAEEVGFRWPVMPLSDAAKAAFFTRLNLEVLYPITADPYTVEAQGETIFTFEADGGNYTGTGDVAVIKYLDEQLTIPDTDFGPNGVQLGTITGAGSSGEIIEGEEVTTGYSLVVFFIDLGFWSLSGNFFKIIRL
jgi:hypothetical protein